MHDAYALWGKARPSTAGAAYPAYHPVAHHMLDVGLVVQALLRDAIHGSMRRFLTRETKLDWEQAISWLSFVGSLHDLGKASPAFQKQGPTDLVHTVKQHFPISKHQLMYPHDSITAFCVKQVLPQVVAAVDPLFAETLGHAVGAHHGTFGYPNGRPPRPGQRGDDPAWKAARRHIVQALIQYLGVQLDTPGQCSQNRAFYVLLAGLTSVADWLGSDQDHFPYAGHRPADAAYAGTANEQATTTLTLHKTGWTVWRPPAHARTFQELFPDKPGLRPLQQAEIA